MIKVTSDTQRLNLLSINKHFHFSVVHMIVVLVSGLCCRVNIKHKATERPYEGTVTLLSVLDMGRK